MAMNVLVLKKEDEKFVFLYGDGDETKAIRQFGMMATDKELRFSWYDAAYLSQRVRAIQAAAGSWRGNDGRTD